MSAASRVLVVEDEVLIRMLAVDMLLDIGHEADEAGSAGEALAMLRAPGAVYPSSCSILGCPTSMATSWCARFVSHMRTCRWWSQAARISSK